MSGKSKKTLPCIAINYEEDPKNGVCPNPALNGPTVNGEKRICYCQYHWEKLQGKNFVNVNYDVVKNFVKDKKVSKDKKNVVISEYKKIKSAITKGGYEVCFEDDKRVLGTSNQCTYKILCKDKKCEDPVYLGFGATSPRSPAGGAKTPAAKRAAATPGVHGKQFSGPLGSGSSKPEPPIIPNVQGASASSKKSSKKPKKDENESDLDDELGSEDEFEMSDSEGEKSGSDYSESDEDASESDEDEIKTKLRVIGYGGNDKKIPDYKTIVKSKGVKPSNKRNIRGRYEIVRSDNAPYIRITSSIVEALEILDNTYDLMEALEKIGFIRDTIKNHPKNINIAAKKKPDQSMWSVEDSVVNYIAEKFAPYVNDSDRIELLLSYIFDYDRRDLTKNFKFYGFTTPKDLLDKTPYERLKFRREGKTYMEETVFPESYNTAFERQVNNMQFTPKEKKSENTGDSNTCSVTKLGNGNDLNAIVNALQNESCLKISPREGTGNKAKDINAVKNSLTNVINNIFNMTSNSQILGKFNLQYNPGQKPSMDKITSVEAKDFINNLYDTLDRFYNEAKTIFDTGKKIDDKSVNDFINNLSDSNKGVIGKLNDKLFDQVFGMTPKSGGGATTPGSAAKSGSPDKNSFEIKFDAITDTDVKNSMNNVKGKFKQTMFKGENSFNGFVKKIDEAAKSNLANLKTSIALIKDENSAANFKKWINGNRDNYATAWDGK
jgi:hypothetical protein